MARSSQQPVTVSAVAAAREALPAADSVLVARIRAGDRDALGVVYQSYYHSLWAFAFGMVRSREGAEEIVHDVFAAIWQQREHWEIRGSIRTYVFSAVRNRALNNRRSERVAAKWLARAIGEHGVSGTGRGPGATDTALCREELQTALHRAMFTLPDRQRQAFDLRWQGGMSYAEIAEVMGISVKSVENTLAKTFKVLRKQLNGFM